MKQAKMLSEKDITKVLAVINRSSFSSRNKCMFMLGIMTGMRVGEIASLYVSDVVDGNGEIKDQIVLKKHQTKGNSSRTVILSEKAQSEIQKYLILNKKTNNQALFVSKAGNMFTANSLCQVFGRIYKKSGISNATSHSTRRTFLTSLANKGVSIHILAALAGHKNISTTMVYLSANQGIQRSAVELL